MTAVFKEKLFICKKNNSRAKKGNKLARLLHLVLHGNYLLDLQQGNKMITERGNSNKHNPVSAPLTIVPPPSHTPPPYTHSTPLTILKS